MSSDNLWINSSIRLRSESSWLLASQAFHTSVFQRLRGYLDMMRGDPRPNLSRK